MIRIDTSNFKNTIRFANQGKLLKAYKDYNDSLFTQNSSNGKSNSLILRGIKWK